MKNKKKYFPGRGDIFIVLGVIVTIEFTWMILIFFGDLPSWIMYLDVSEILVIFAYGSAWALIESLIILSILFVIILLLPGNLLSERFLSQGSTLVLSIVLLLLSAQQFFTPYFIIPVWEYWIIYLALVIAVFGLNILIHQSPMLTNTMKKFAIQLSVFNYIYIPLGVICCIIVIFRNLL